MRTKGKVKHRNAVSRCAAFAISPSTLTRRCVFTNNLQNCFQNKTRTRTFILLCVLSQCTFRRNILFKKNDIFSFTMELPSF